jgi:hypothetical protein
VAHVRVDQVVPVVQVKAAHVLLALVVPAVSVVVLAKAVVPAVSVVDLAALVVPAVSVVDLAVRVQAHLVAVVPVAVVRAQLVVAAMQPEHSVRVVASHPRVASQSAQSVKSLTTCKRQQLVALPCQWAADRHFVFSVGLR